MHKKKKPKVEGPRECGEWRVLKVPGGWLRYSTLKGRCDAHCGTHLRCGCKLDRSLCKGSLGLSMAWLTLAKDYDVMGHKDVRKHIGQPAFLQERRAGRTLFMELAASKQGIYQEVLEKEKELYGSSEEPAMVC